MSRIIWDLENLTASDDAPPRYDVGTIIVDYEREDKIMAETVTQQAQQGFADQLFGVLSQGMASVNAARQQEGAPPIAVNTAAPKVGGSIPWVPILIGVAVIAAFMMFKKKR
jgi:hypothetical protein